MVYSILTVWNASTVPLQILPILQSLIQILSLQEDSFDPIQISPCCSWFLLVLESFNNSTPHILGPIWSVYVLSPQFPEDRDHSVCFPRSSLWCLAAHSVLVLCIQMIFHVTCTALAEYPSSRLSLTLTALGQWLPWNIATKRLLSWFETSTGAGYVGTCVYGECRHAMQTLNQDEHSDAKIC